MDFDAFRKAFDTSFAKVEPGDFVRKMESLGYKFKTTPKQNMKKILGFLPTWIVYYIGHWAGLLATEYEIEGAFGEVLWDIFQWGMVRSGEIQDWAGLSEPWMEPEIDKKDLEIERRWIMKHAPDVKPNNILFISQYYTPSGRFRSSHDGEKFTYYHTVKTDVSHGVNKEIENEVTVEQFNAAKETATSYINKYRYLYNYNDHTFEVDGILFAHGSPHPSMWIVEVELNDINEPIEFPTYIGDLVVKEITGDKAFSNYKMSVKI